MTKKDFAQIHFSREYWQRYAESPSLFPYWDNVPVGGNTGGYSTRVFVCATWISDFQKWKAAADTALRAACVSYDRFKNAFVMIGGGYQISAKPEFLWEDAESFGGAKTRLLWVNAAAVQTEDDFKAIIARANAPAQTVGASFNGGGHLVLHPSSWCAVRPAAAADTVAGSFRK